MTGILVHSFPNPVPDGTSVPQWALLDVTVRYYPSYIQHELTQAAHPSFRIVGAPTIRGPLVVRIIHFVFVDSSNPYFSDTPEIPAGALIGSSSTSTRTAATASATQSTPPTAVVSSDSKGKSSNTGPIVGGVVAAIAIIAVAVLGFFYLQRRGTGPQYAAPSSTHVANHESFSFDGVPQPQRGSIKGPSDDGHHASSMSSSVPASPSMRVYVRAFVSFRLVRSSSCSFSQTPRIRTTQRHFRASRQLPIPRAPLPVQFMVHNKAQAQETRWPTCRLRGRKAHKAIMAYLPSDHHPLSFILILDSWRCSRTQIRHLFLYLVGHTRILTRTIELIFYGVLVEWTRCYFTSFL